MTTHHIDRTNKGHCPVCSEPVCWDETYVRVPYIQTDPNADYEVFFHLPCFSQESESDSEADPDPEDAYTDADSAGQGQGCHWPLDT